MADKTITIPGGVDLHVHFREPGDNKAETIKSGSKAALQGGYALVCDMPNNPGNPTWTMKRLRQKQDIINKSAYIPIATYAGSQPESNNLQELAAMAKSTIGLKLYAATTTGNHKDYDPAEFDEIVATWHKVAPDKPIMLHSGRDNLSDFINLVAKRHKHQLHVCHIFSAEHGRLVSEAKQKGMNVSSGVCPHHLLKSSHQTITEGWFARMQPPLLHQDEADELMKMFADGKIDILETDHAPHLTSVKWAAEKENPVALVGPDHTTCFGVPGIEFALPLLFYQMKRGAISLERIVEATSTRPAEIIGVKLLPSTKVTWQMSEYRIGEDYPKGLSGSGWTPYLNNIAVGKVWESRVANKLLIKDGEILEPMSEVSQRGDVI